MAENLFEELKQRKENLLSLVSRASEFGWITADRAKEIIAKIESDTLTIGVIGQMKCGKSTFLNSFVFGDTILPAATTPMTAALSVITYGNEKKIKAEFYSPDEWAEQKMQSNKSLEDAQGNSAEESKIKAAKELVSKAVKLGSQLNSYLGKTQEDSFENLIEYVGADGKYISITKSVTIYYPMEYLKGVEIVDTPGFNDPIVSREERTKDFLNKADVVLMMLYAGRPFDATDRDIIFKNVRQCGIGKVLIGINKYDIPYCSENNPEDEEQIKDYVIKEIQKASSECGDNTLSEILSDTTPIPLSAEMALLSMLPMSKIESDSALNFAWNRHCNGFGISTQAEMRKWSHIDHLSSAVKTMINSEKDQILFAKPLNAILAAGNNLLSETENQIQLLSSQIEMLKMPDDELEEKEEKINKAHKKLSRKINSLGEDIESELRNIIRKGNERLEDDVDAACRRMHSIVDNEWGIFSNIDSIKPKLNNEINTLATRTLKRSVSAITDDAKRVIDSCVSDFFGDTESILMRYLPDFDSNDFVKKVKNRTILEVTDSDLFSIEDDPEDDDNGILDFLGDFFNGVSFGVLGKLTNAMNKSGAQAAAHSHINNISSSFNPKPYLENAMSQRDKIIDLVKTSFITQLIEPLQAQIAEIKNQKGDKEARLKSAQNELTEEINKKKKYEEQFELISQLSKQTRQ